MSWYFYNDELKQLRCVTPRVASTSQREYWPERGFRRVEVDEARSLARKRAVKVAAVIRSPLGRLFSAYQRHRPGTVKEDFQTYVCERYSWDSHIQPQTDVHKLNGIKVDTWELFDDLIDLPDFPKKNETPPEHKSRNAVHLSEDWLEWYYEVYNEDIWLHHDLTVVDMKAG